MVGLGDNYELVSHFSIMLWSLVRDLCRGTSTAGSQRNTKITSELLLKQALSGGLVMIKSEHVKKHYYQ